MSRGGELHAVRAAHAELSCGLGYRQPEAAAAIDEDVVGPKAYPLGQASEAALRDLAVLAREATADGRHRFVLRTRALGRAVRVTRVRCGHGVHVLDDEGPAAQRYMTGTNPGRQQQRGCRGCERHEHSGSRYLRAVLVRVPRCRLISYESKALVVTT